MTAEDTSMNPERGRRKSMVGVVVSNKMDKTAVVAVERRVRHALYRKIVRQTKRYKVHDATNSAVLGDIVRIVETRPISKEKRWRIAETLTAGNVAEVAPREIGVPEEALLTPQPPPEAAPRVETRGTVAEATETAADIAEATEPSAEAASESAAMADSEVAEATEPTAEPDADEAEEKTT
jgi:small subunit ribosomal protein S17